jgi:hypothetical protein
MSVSKQETYTFNFRFNQFSIGNIGAMAAAGNAIFGGGAVSGDTFAPNKGIGVRLLTNFIRKSIR